MSRFAEIKSKQYRGNGFMTVAKFSGDGNMIYVGDKDSKNITAICTRTYSVSNNFVAHNAHNGVVWSLDLSNDDKILISCSGDLTICFWDTTTTELLHKFSENCIPKIASVQKNILHNNQFNFVCVSCEAISRRSKTYLLIYDLNDIAKDDFNYKYKLSWNNQNKINCIEWMSENILILGCDDGQIILRNIEDIDGENETKHKFHDNQIKSICWNKAFSNILTGSLDMTSKIINVENWQVLNTFVSTAPINFACYNFNERKIFVGGGADAINVAKISKNDLSLKIFKIHDGKLMQKMDCHFGPIRFISKSPSNKNFLTASQDGIVKIHICENENETVINDDINTTCYNTNKIFLLDEINKFENVNWKPPKINPNDVKIKKWVPGMPRNENENTRKSELFTVSTELNNSTLNSIENFKEDQNKTNASIRITNLPPYISTNELNDIFDLYGRIEERGIRIKKYDDTTMAFINYSFPESAHKAIIGCDGLPIEHYIIRVEMAQHK